MVVSYIEFMLDGDKTQEIFNKSVARAKRIVTADHDNFIIIRLVSSADYNDDVELVRVSYEFDKVNIAYNEAMLPKFALNKPMDDESDEYVYIVSFNQVWECEELSNDCRVYANKEDAIKFFKEIIEDEKKSIDEELGYKSEYWELRENLSEKYGIGSWEYYLDSDANSNHSYIYLDKKEIRTK